jgi:ATP-dependent Clp protease ATP-binding subunit ClpC
MLRFDMSEYASADALPRLIGSAWRSENEGELTRRVREQPFCVVLLDELEKAHPDVFDALLGVLGEGRLTDAGGRSADFRNAIIIMTSNLGAGRRDLQSVGFGQQSGADEARGAWLADHFVKAAEAFFRPEFFNRIDRIVAFRSLSQEAVRLITRRELGKLLMREGIVRRNLLVEVDEAVIARLAEQGFHPHYGARPLQRAIERAVILPLARILVDGAADHRHLVRFTLRDGEVHPRLVVVDAGEEPTPAEATPAPDRRLEPDLAAVVRAIARIRKELELAEAGELAQGLRDESFQLLAQTRVPTFWDTPDTARAVLQRIYRLERVVKRLDSLTERAARLEDRAQHLRRQRDRRNLPDLAAQVERLEMEVSFLQAEMAGLPGGEEADAVLLCVNPITPEADDWARQVQRMYELWAERKGYQCVPVSADAAERTRLPHANGVFLQGSGVFQFLRAESGLHKLNAGSAEDRRRHLARVFVYAAPEAVDGESPLALASRLVSATPAEDEGEVARIYQAGRHRYVRDPRTGVRITHVDAVLKEGQIDSFLLAHLQRTSPGGGTE